MLPDKKIYYAFGLLLFAFCLPACKKESVFQKRAKPEIVIQGDDPRLQSDNIRLYKDTSYVLSVNLVREAGQTLTIEAGTLIKVNDRLSITINEGAKIEAKGTSADPIIFTSASPKGGAGVGTGTTGGEHYWFGIRVYGNSLVNPSLSSGTITYTRIEFAGYENILGASLLLQNVSKATTIESVQVSYSFNSPSFEFDGGDVNAVQLVSYASSLNDFYIHNGYTGMLQHLLAYRHPYFPVNRPGPDLTGLLLQDNTTFPVISNLTVLGPGLQKETNFTYADTTSARVAAMVVNTGAKFHIRNSVFMGFAGGGIYMADNASAKALHKSESDLSHSIVHCNDSTRAFFLPRNTYPPFTSESFKDFMLQPLFGNQLFLNAADFMFADAYNYDINPDPLAKQGSPLLSGADFNGKFSDPFFKKVSYRGALGTDNWLRNWTNFIPLQTNYNH